MMYLASIPHRIARGMCPVNGIRDLVHWRTGKDWSNEFLFGLGQGGGFAYLRIKVADPPRQVYWGIASPRQHKYLADLLEADYYELENRSFKRAWSAAREAVVSGTPPVIGPLDMYYLNFYEEIYHQRHIPIHYLLLVGYNAQQALVYDTGHANVQAIPLSELELAWQANVPGLGKRNRLVSLSIPEKIDATEAIICRSIRDECVSMLRPPVSLLGIPAMEKLGREISKWPDKLGKEVADRCLRQVREYLNSPPDIMGNHLTAGRDIYITFLKQASEMAGFDFHNPIDLFTRSMNLVPSLNTAIQQGDLISASGMIEEIASLEKDAYTQLLAVIEPN